jgi:transposase
LEEVAVRARKTDRLEEALLAIALELGGRAGTRLAPELGIVAARDTLLKRIKGAPLPEVGKVSVLGVDDFAFKKGSTYGTILVNLEDHKVVDLLPERSQESLVAWFGSHPGAGVEVASRDRSNIYREGLAKGAPGARHVADRWHLLHNLTLTLEEYLLQKRPLLSKAAAPQAAPEEKDDDFGSGPIMANRPTNHDRKIEQAARKRHERLVEQWRNIRRLYLAGADLRHICKRLGISARTVYRYKDLTEPPPRPAYKRKASVLDPYVPYLLRRWNEGCHNGKKLYREIREQGYRNSEERPAPASPHNCVAQRPEESRSRPSRGRGRAPLPDDLPQRRTWPPCSCATKRSSMRSRKSSSRDFARPTKPWPTGEDSPRSSPRW